MRILSALLLFTCALAAQPNLLAPKEAADGWILLFDGETLFGWSQEGAAKWRVEAGALVADAGQTGWLRHNSTFKDFILRADFRIGQDGNSGIFFRSKKEGDPAKTGYELQIWDKHEKFPTGSLVNFARAKKATLKPGVWHTYEVSANGEAIAVKLDGKQVLRTTDRNSALGFIGLQSNKDKVEFRNLKLKPLGMKPLFNGKTLAGWRVVNAPKPPKEPPEWSVRSGAIHVEKGPGLLATEGTWADFVLQLDIRANAQSPTHHPNSGVFFRGDSDTPSSGYEAQIRNEYKDGDRTKPVDYGTGAIYNRVATRKVVTNDNEYFTKTIAAYGRHLAVWLNGYPVTDWDDPRPDHKSARQGYRAAAGPISFQAHDPTTNLDFKAIRIVAVQ